MAMNLKHLIIFLYFLALTLAVYAECGDYNNHDAYNKCLTRTSTSTPTPTSIYCQVSGGPGWENKIHAGVSQGIEHSEFKSPQECCKYCLGIIQCNQWEFVSVTGSVNICRTWDNDGKINVCNFMEVNTTVIDGGILHCNNGY
ncbi:12797_t:CDS:1 [Cetraspora pellucida]|uniref:12797_t:CDS:1 n=1 Tax=Cetraspora pellucida TaxID=1433469 RepID=A0ACA9L7Q8_9GLOM|nr:12797_t:CDS:1 [Cetraspora pellucida]